MLSAAGKGLSTRTLLQVAWRGKWLVLISTAAVTLAAVTYTVYHPVMYKAQALLGVEVARDYIQRQEAPTRVQDQLLTIREVLLSRPFLEPVMENYRLFHNDNGRFSDADLEKMRERIKITVDGDDSFHLGFESGDRYQVTSIANDLASRFIKQLSQTRETQVAGSTSLLDAELERLRTALDSQEKLIAQYKGRAVNELPDRLETNLRMLAATQAQIQSTASDKANDQAKLAAVTAEMAELQKQGVLETQGTKEKSLQEINLDDLRLRVKQMRAVYTDQYPELVNAERELRDLEKAVAAAPPKPASAEPSVAQMRYSQLKAERESLELRLKDYAREEQGLDSQVGHLQARVQSTPQHENAIAELSRDYEATKVRYNALLTKQQEARLATGLERVNKTASFKLIEPAAPPPNPSTPRRSRILLLGLFAGMGLGFLAALALEQMDTTFGSIAEFQAFTTLPVLAALPNLSAEGKKDSPAVTFIPTGGGRAHVQLSPAVLQANHIVSLTNPESVATEQYRMLGLKIRRKLAANKSSPVLAITSFVGGEGKTVTSLNLSLALASTVSGRVLLIDTDLRKPRVHEYLGVPRTAGFSDLLLAPADELGKYIWKLRDLYVMTGGANLVNPVGLLASKNTSSVIERLRSEFDLIVIDTPPLLPVADSHILAGLADGVAMVVRARQTRREVVTLGLESFQGPNLLGAVMNDFDFQGSAYGYAYQSYAKQYTGT
jgi:polysaccharide chain length determinant protein (PEP-CTERM system associated)